MDANEIWEKHQKYCPWRGYKNECTAQFTSFNHSSGYGLCVNESCGVFFWIEKLLKEKL